MSHNPRYVKLRYGYKCTSLMQLCNDTQTSLEATRSFNRFRGFLSLSVATTSRLRGPQTDPRCAALLGSGVRALSLGIGWCGRWCCGEWVGTGGLAGPGEGEAGEEVWPSDSMHFGFLVWEVTVLELEPGTSSNRFQRDLHGAGTGREQIRTGVPPGDDEAVGRVEFDVVAADRDTIAVQSELSAGSGIEDGVVAHPAPDRLRLGEEGIHHRWWCCDLDRGAVGLSRHGQTQPLV